MNRMNLKKGEEEPFVVGVVPASLFFMIPNC